MTYELDGFSYDLFQKSRALFPADDLTIRFRKNGYPTVVINMSDTGYVWYNLRTQWDERTFLRVICDIVPYAAEYSHEDFLVVNQWLIENVYYTVTMNPVQPRTFFYDKWAETKGGA